MSSRTNVSSTTVASHLADILPGLNRAIDAAFTNYTPAASPAVNAAIVGDTATLARLRQQFRIVATVIPPLDGKHYRLRVETFVNGSLYDYAIRYKLSEDQAQDYASVINGKSKARRKPRTRRLTPVKLLQAVARAQAQREAQRSK